MTDTPRKVQHVCPLMSDSNNVARCREDCALFVKNKCSLAEEGKELKEEKSFFDGCNLS